MDVIVTQLFQNYFPTCPTNSINTVIQKLLCIYCIAGSLAGRMFGEFTFSECLVEKV